MNRNDIKRILISMRTAQNESQINNLLGKIDLLPEEKLQTMIIQIGDNEESIRKYLEGKLSERRNNVQEEHTSINQMFSYGVSENCIHLHIPVDLHEMMSKKGIKKTIDLVNLHLLDAIERILKHIHTKRKIYKKKNLLQHILKLNWLFIYLVKIVM